MSGSASISVQTFSLGTKSEERAGQGSSRTLSVLEDRRNIFEPLLAWKKKKDEFLKRHKINVQNKKEEMIMESFMDTREKKMEADAAFSAWRDHKSHISKMNKKRRAWIMQKQKEEENKKIRRDKEALHMYDMWLENKNSPAKRKASDLAINKPPWSPPGKSYTLKVCCRCECKATVQAAVSEIGRLVYCDRLRNPMKK
ncbi:hypothetical protein TNIN_264261 [Trichonephila inaurata madagascariensis]|uniref:Uncharacterized protein n=1 Tax=Trichonephila inaurata madagascariensis TaxID=2747483 RepID=A0A8X7C811_9ARAC|nr:hypothetical protein TNIN_264261 [Trichonephila inaurata madagascariensis]